MRIIKWTLGLLVLVVGLLVVAFFLIPAERIASVVADRFEASTGRSLSFASVSPSLLPLGVSVQGLEISNADWASAPSILRAEQLNVSVEAASLLSGAPRVTAVRILAPEISLESGPEGGNWVFAGPAGQGDQSVDAGSGAVPDFRLDVIEVVGGQVSYSSDGQNTLVEELNLTTGWAGAQAPLVVVADAQVGTSAFAAEFEVEKPGAAVAGEASPVSVLLGLGAAQAKLGGVIEAGQISGDLRLNLPDSGRVLRDLGLGEVDLPKDFGRDVALTANVTASPEVVSLTNLAANSGQTSVSGSVSIALDAEVPMIAGQLSAPTLDLSAFSGDEDAETAEAEGWSKDPIVLSGLDAVNGNIGFAVGKVLYGPSEFTDLSGALSLSGGKASLRLDRMAAYGGTISGGFDLRGGSSLSAGGSLNAVAVGLKPFMRDFFDFERIEGSGDVAVSASGTGASVHALMNGLNGSGEIRFGRGEIAGVDLLGMLRNLDAAYGTSGSTIFESITGTFKIEDGVVANVDLNFLAPLLEAVGEGTIGLGDQTVDYRVTPRILKGEAEGISVPVLITGSWSNLKFRPDLEGLIDLKAKEVVEEVKEEVRQKVDDAVKDVEDELKSKVEEQLKKGLGGLLGGN